MGLIPRRAPFATNKKSVADIQRELCLTGKSRVYGLGTFTTKVIPEKSFYNFILARYQLQPERTIVEFEMDFTMRNLLNDEWYGNERDHKRSNNSYVPPRSIGLKTDDD